MENDVEGDGIVVDLLNFEMFDCHVTFENVDIENGQGYPKRYHFQLRR